MKKPPPKRRPKEWTLAKVRQTCPSAPAVWVALCDMAAERGSNLVTPTRESLAAATGIKKPGTISEALTALTKAQWIDRILVASSQNGLRTTLLRIVLRRSARKTVRTGQGSVDAEKRHDSRCRKTGADFPYGKGRDSSSPRPASLTVAGRAPVAPAPPGEQHPAARIERERLAAIRAARERRADTDAELARAMQEERDKAEKRKAALRSSA